MKTEPRTLFRTDFLQCRGCGREIWFPDPYAPTWRFRDIDKHYRDHVKQCFAIKRIIVAQRQNKTAHNLVN